MRLLTMYVRRMPLRIVETCCAALAYLAVGLTIGCRQSSETTPIAKEDSAPPTASLEGLPQRVTNGGYVSSSVCQSCHPREHASWRKTFHSRMTQEASVEAVIAPFEGEEFSLGDSTYRMTRRDDEFWVEKRPISQEPDGGSPSETQRIVMTTGSHHMQGYWVRRDRSNLLDQFPLMWLLEDGGHGRWVPKADCFLSPPSASNGPPPWTSTWNMNCITCHSVNGVPGIHRHADVADTTVAELGIACEACHGPGQGHVAAYKDLSRKDPGAANNVLDTAIVNPKRLKPERAAQVCGQCHGLLQFTDSSLYEDWFLFGRDYRPGADLREKLFVVSPSYIPADEMKSIVRDRPGFVEETSWPDGMVRVAREYNGLVESACYKQGGMTCFNCHSMHDSDPNDQLAAGMQTNEACYRCHSSYREQIEAHSHHLADSSGSLCYNCHMPHTTYTLLKGIRSHQIASPNVAVSVDTGRPNACNLCHLDQPLAWTAEKLSQWYGQKPVELDEDQQGISAAVLSMLRGDAVQRALAASACGWQAAREASGEDWEPPFLACLLEDPYSAVRLIAGRSLKKLGYDLNYDYLAPESSRKAARRAAIDEWQRRPAATNRDVPARLLLDREGRLEEDELRRLLSGRDDRPLSIAE